MLKESIAVSKIQDLLGFKKAVSQFNIKTMVLLLVFKDYIFLQLYLYKTDFTSFTSLYKGSFTFVFV